MHNSQKIDSIIGNIHKNQFITSFFNRASLNINNHIKSLEFVYRAAVDETINYVKYSTRQQTQYFPLLQKLFKLFLCNLWALILNVYTYLLQKLKFLNYIYYISIYNEFENS